MIQARRRENESPSGLFFRFVKKVRRSGILAEARKRRFHSRNINRNKRRNSAIYRESRRKEIEQERKFGNM